MKDRIIYFDLLRGLAIIGVIAIHSLGIGYTFNDRSMDFNLTVFGRQVINFSVPLFLAISGFFLANKETKTMKSYFKFIKKQVPRVLIPYLVWSILYLGLSYSRGASLSSLVNRLFTFESSFPFYFIILIIEYYLFLPVMQKLATPKGLIISALISFLSCFFIFYFRYYTNITLPLNVYASAPSWLIFFVLGIYLKNNIVNIHNKELIILIILGLFLSLVETYALYFTFNNIGNSVTSIKISSFIYSIFIIIFAFKNINRNYTKNRLVTYLGEISFGIYLSHIFFMNEIVHPIINKFFPIIKDITFIYQFTIIILTLCCCLIFSLIARRINKISAIKYLGQ